MAHFQNITPAEIGDNPFGLIGKDWFLLTAANREGGYNTMTASWGGLGVLWNKPVCFVFVRKGRHTHHFTEEGDRFTLSFFSEEWRDALRFCGKFSGRDVDKAKACSLTPVRAEGGGVYFEEARLVLCAKKIYATELKEAEFLDPSLLSHYEDGDFHTVYVCEICNVLQKA